MRPADVCYMRSVCRNDPSFHRPETNATTARYRNLSMRTADDNTATAGSSSCFHTDNNTTIVGSSGVGRECDSVAVPACVSLLCFGTGYCMRKATEGIMPLDVLAAALLRRPCRAFLLSTASMTHTAATLSLPLSLPLPLALAFSFSFRSTGVFCVQRPIFNGVRVPTKTISLQRRCANEISQNIKRRSGTSNKYRRIPEAPTRYEPFCEVAALGFGCAVAPHGDTPQKTKSLVGTRSAKKMSNLKCTNILPHQVSMF